MNARLQLPARLRAAAGMIPPGARVADIGTDHGLLPAYLAQTGAYPCLIASDVGEKPLAAARRTAEACGVSERIDFRCADGLDGLEPDRVDTVVIAGMGGETISAILTRAPWLRAGGVRLILQPQSKLGVLTSWLEKNGFALTGARLAAEGRRIYLLLCAEAAAPGTRASAERLLLRERDPLLPRYLDARIARLEKALRGMSRARGERAAGEEEACGRELAELCEIREATKSWLA